MVPVGFQQQRHGMVSDSLRPYGGGLVHRVVRRERISQRGLLAGPCPKRWSQTYPRGVRVRRRDMQFHNPVRSDARPDVQFPQEETVGSPFFFNDTAPTEIYTLFLHDWL